MDILSHIFLVYLVMLWHGCQHTAAEVCTDTVCEYTFNVRKAHTMTYLKPDPVYVNIAYNVGMDGRKLVVIPNSLRENGTDDLIGKTVNIDDVITMDGYDRHLIVINDKLPGPTIDVMEGAEVVVHLINEMLYEGITMHWHGIHVVKTPWMDGVGYLTQCPIHPRQNFTYRFKAEPAGTHWYHPHFRSMRIDGGFGMIRIHKSLPKPPAFQLMVVDWLHDGAQEVEVLNPFAVKYRGTGQLFKPYSEVGYSIDGVEAGELSRTQFSITVNGRGRFYPDQLIPYERFGVVKDQEYVFHLINAGIAFAMEISIDNHMLTVIASDGSDITPVNVTSIMIFHGETIDFKVVANQPTDLYWLRVKTLRVGHGPTVIPDNVTIEGFAVFQYQGANKTHWEEPTTSPRICSAESPCTIFNCPFENYPEGLHMTCFGYDKITSTVDKDTLESKFGVSDPDYEEVFLNFNFARGSCINGRKFVNPTGPLYEGLKQNMLNCEDVDCKEGCLCTHIQDIPYNKTIQMVLTNLYPYPGSWDYDHHPIHMHGHSYAVLKVGYPQYNHTTGHWTEPNQDVYCENRYCAPAKWNDTAKKDFNTENPPIKDTLILPARGYAVIRFRSNNPGFWFMHCHTEQHIMDGMAVVLHEAPEHIPPLPPGFPTCINNYEFTEKEYQQYQKGDFPPKEENIQCNTNAVELDMGTAIGASLGFVALGVLLTIIARCCVHYCSKRRKHHVASRLSIITGNDDVQYDNF